MSRRAGGSGAASANPLLEDPSLKPEISEEDRAREIQRIEGYFAETTLKVKVSSDPIIASRTFDRDDDSDVEMSDDSDSEMSDGGDSENPDVWIYVDKSGNLEIATTKEFGPSKSEPDEQEVATAVASHDRVGHLLRFLQDNPNRVTKATIPTTNHQHLFKIFGTLAGTQNKSLFGLDVSFGYYNEQAQSIDALENTERLVRAFVNLESFSIHKTKLDDSAHEGWQAVFASLQTLKFLEELHLVDANIEDNVAIHLSNFLGLNKKIKIFEISDDTLVATTNPITTQLTHNLASNESLKKLIY
jgi:hypothetical protein